MKVRVNGANEVENRWWIARYIFGDYWFIAAYETAQEAADHLNDAEDLCLIDGKDQTIVMW